jgi:hypothetical protein
MIRALHETNNLKHLVYAFSIKHPVRALLGSLLLRRRYGGHLSKEQMLSLSYPHLNLHTIVNF